MMRISVPTNRTLSSTGPLRSENVAIGFKTSIKAYFAEEKKHWDPGAA